MKYNENNKPLVCMQTMSKCYKQTRIMTVEGVLWHTTGANNPKLKRYVQPSDDAPDRNFWLNLLGKNLYNNDWNHSKVEAGMNAWIGKLADGSVTTVQTMPWSFRPWGCAKGKNGSCNDGWIQFEICEDNLKNKDYFDEVYTEACEVTAYLCNLYGLSPWGNATLNKVKVPVILCHADSYKLGLGSNHGDVYTWFNKYGKTMDDVRRDVAALMNIQSNEQTSSEKVVADNSIKAGDVVSIAANATYYSGGTIPSWVRNKTWIVRTVGGNRAVIDKSEDGKSAIRSPINTKYLTVVDMNNHADNSEFVTYNVKVTSGALNIRKNPGTNYESIGMIVDKGVYTIIDEASGIGASKWGKLKSGVGWISLDYTKRI